MLFALARPALFLLDPEDAHRLSLAALRTVPIPSAPADPRLRTELAGLSFPTPLGVAPGYDKNAEAPDALLKLGFGFAEIGTVTPLPQAGNPRPRLFRLAADRAVINRMGFNNDGLAAVRARLERRRGGGIVGVNVGANKDAADRVADYATGVRAMAPVADYLTINVSSPNTPGLRDLQGERELHRLLAAVAAAREPGGPPVFLKVAPDLDADVPRRIVAAVREHALDGIIVANTTISRPPLRSPWSAEAGGLSGAPLRPLALERLRDFHRAGEGALALIGVGGIANAEDAWERIRAGASLVQLYSAMIYEGPLLARRINRGLVRLMERDGFSSIAEAVGSA